MASTAEIYSPRLKLVSKLGLDLDSESEYGEGGEKGEDPGDEEQRLNRELNRGSNLISSEEENENNEDPIPGFTDLQHNCSNSRISDPTSPSPSPTPLPPPPSSPPPITPSVSVPKSSRIIKEGWLNAYIKYTEGQESPQAFHFYTGVTILSAALRRHIWVDQAYFKVYPNIYTCLVAMSATCRKTAAANIGYKMLGNLKDVTIFHEKGSTEGLIEYMSTTEPHSVGSRIVSDSSIFIYAPELSVFFSTASYSADLAMVLTSLYDGKDKWQYKTRTKEPIDLTNLAPSMLGASTPGMLAKIISMDTIEGGFSGRMLYVVQTEKGKRISRPKKSPEIMQLEKELISDLRRIANIYGEMKLTPEADKFYDDWYQAYDPPTNDPRLAGYYQRLPTLIFKLAMILAVSKSDSKIIDVPHLKMAMKCLEELEKTMGQAFQYVGSAGYAIGEEVVHAIQRAGGIVRHKDLVAIFRQKVKNLQELKDIIDSLVDAGVLWIKVDQHKYYVLTNLTEADFQMRRMQSKGAL